MADYPLLSWHLINPSSSKNIIMEPVLPTSGSDYGGTLVDEWEPPVEKWVFMLKFAPNWKVDEVRAAHRERNGTYTLSDVQGRSFTGRIEQMTWPCIEGTELVDLTITMIEEPLPPEDV